jgi:hypothetical protein
MPHAAQMIGDSLPTDENGVPILENAVNIPLFLPSTFPPNVHALSETRHACEVEQHLHEAVADDALAKIQRQHRIVQSLWQFKWLNVAGTGNRPQYLNAYIIQPYPTQN